MIHATEEIRITMDGSIYKVLLDYANKFKQIELNIAFHCSFELIQNDFNYWFTTYPIMPCPSDPSYASTPCNNATKLIKDLKKKYAKALKEYKQTKKGK